MARLQILQLPEGAGDRRPPFILVIDEAAKGSDGELLIKAADFVEAREATNARDVFIFEETVTIPANDVLPLPLLSVQGDSQTAELIAAHEQTRLALCDAFCLSLDSTWAQIVETAMQRQREVAGLRRELDGVPKAGQDQHKAALTDALGMDPLRDWDDIYNTAAGLRRDRDAQAEAIERVRRTSTEPEVMDSQQEHPTVWMHGYHCGVLAARDGLRPRNEKASTS